MKNFIITILVVLGIIYLFGELSDRWFVLHLDDMHISDSIIGMVIAGCVAAGLLLMGFLLAVSLLGALFLAFAAAALGVVFVGIHLFWPLLFIGLIIYLIVGGNKETA